MPALISLFVLSVLYDLTLAPVFIFSTVDIGLLFSYNMCARHGGCFDDEALVLRSREPLLLAPYSAGGIRLGHTAASRCVGRLCTHVVLTRAPRACAVCGVVRV